MKLCVRKWGNDKLLKVDRGELKCQSSSKSMIILSQQATIEHSLRLLLSAFFVHLHHEKNATS